MRIRNLTPARYSLFILHFIYHLNCSLNNLINKSFVIFLFGYASMREIFTISGNMLLQHLMTVASSPALFLSLSLPHNIAHTLHATNCWALDWWVCALRATSTVASHLSHTPHVPPALSPWLRPSLRLRRRQPNAWIAHKTKSHAAKTIKVSIKICTTRGAIRGAAVGATGGVAGGDSDDVAEVVSSIWSHALIH